MRRYSTRHIWSNAVSPEWLLMLGLCLAAAVRVSIFAAAFPFFTNLDEQRHVDLVLKFSRGYWPVESIEPFDLASGRLFSLYGTWEYLNHPERVPEHRKIPLCIVPPEKTEKLVSQLAATWSEGPNFEAQSPPAYYAVAGSLYRMAGFLGLRAIERLYLLRLLNAFLAGLLVLAAYLLCRQEFPDHGVMRRGVPLLTAFVPSDVFYSVNSDVLSPLLFALALLMGLRWFRSEKPSATLGVLLGLLVCATFLVKVTNIALPIIFLLACTWKAAMTLRDRSRGPSWTTIFIPALSAGLPLLLWILRNYAFFGDLTGNGAKMNMLGWAWKPAAELFNHPIFTAKGFWSFWSNLMNTLWRGELFWHGTLLHSLWADRLFSLSSTVFILAALVSAVWRRVYGIRHSSLRMTLSRTDSQVDKGRAETQSAMILSLLLSIMCLVWLSLALDFGDWFDPSRANPFLSSGRLIAGALVPLLVLYVQGLYSLLPGGHRDTLCLIVLVLLCACMTISDIMVNMPVFGSLYNLYHLWTF